MAAAALIATLPGMRFFNQGQLEGETIKVPVQLGRRLIEPANAEIKSFYQKLLSITSQDVFHQQGWKLLEIKPAWENNWTHLNLIGYSWKSGSTICIVVINLSSQPAQGYIFIPELDARTESVVFDDRLNDAVYYRNPQEIFRNGLYVDLYPYRSHIFDVRG